MKNKQLIDKMTLYEKASLLSGKSFWESRDVKRLSISSITLSDGPSGVRRQADGVDHLGLHPGLPATCFPSSSTIANSWNIKIAEMVGKCIGEEAVSLQVSVLLGPGLNIKRNPLCGRNFEYFSEDPYLSGKMAANYIKGIQQNGISACPKHFAVNNQERHRMSCNSVVDERTLHEIYLTGFEIAVKEGKPYSIMSSYNPVNGVYINNNPWFLQKKLIEEWGFEGFVVTDWGGSNNHIEGIKAGVHLEMPTTQGNSIREVVEAVQNGTLSEHVVNERVDEFLSAISKIKKLSEMEKKDIDIEAHHHLAELAAEESIVLLKNEKDLLPLKAGTKIAVIGDFAEVPRYQGAGSSMVNPTKLESVLTCIDETELEFIGFSKGFERTGSENANLLNTACTLAEKVDVVLVFIGLDEMSECEGLDREHIKIRDNQIQLLKELSKINDNIVAILSCGSVIEMPWHNKCKAILHGYLGGQAAASAILNIITGKVCPSGKLSETYPLKYDDCPNYSYFPGYEATAEYREGIFVGYRFYDTVNIPVLYPFGFGLSYTKFNYENIEVNEKGVSFIITNIGNCDGAEIAQLYVGMDNNIVFRPSKELKGFTKVYLKKGESKKVTISFDDKTFRYYDVKTKKFEIESGKYTIVIGSSSRDIKLQAAYDVAGTKASIPYTLDSLPNYFKGDVKHISDEEFRILLGYDIPRTKWDKTKDLTENDNLSQLYYSKSLIARLTYHIINSIRIRAEKKGKPNLNILFIYNLSFSGIAKMSDGNVDINMVKSILTMVNGHVFKGLLSLIGKYFKMKKENKKLSILLTESKNSNNLLKSLKNLKIKYANAFEFIMFNLLSNIATITNFTVLNICQNFIFASLASKPFSFWVFDYGVDNGGLAGFLSFLISYACAQTVNFIVQRKLVFNSNNKLGKSIAIYIFTILIIYFVCLYIPTLVLPILTDKVGSFWAMNLANAINIIVQVIVVYPVMKFVVMKKFDEEKVKEIKM